MLQSAKDTFFSRKESLKCGGKLLDISIPVVMGILNVTTDSFYDGGRYTAESHQFRQIEKMLTEGAAIIDIGAASTRPGARPVAIEDELKLLLPLIRKAVKEFPGIFISVDTYHADVAERSVGEGADIINDISGGTFDTNMLRVAGKLGVPYIMMHIKGVPQNMQDDPFYDDVVDEIILFFARQIDEARKHGIADIILDPGFGFGKLREHNYDILSRLEDFRIFELPLMAGLSRKSMINKVLNTIPEESLNGTTVLNTIALMKGASVLRVHDVKEAMEAITLCNEMVKEKESLLND